MTDVVMSDSLFLSLSLIWLSFILLGIKKFKTSFFYATILLSIVLLFFRFTGMIYIGLSFLLYLPHIIEKRNWIHYLIAAVFVIFTYQFICIQTEKDTGFNTFSGFGGWQLANNGLHANPFIKNIDNASIKDPEVLFVQKFVLSYFDSVPIESKASIFYLWDVNSPLTQMRKNTDSLNTPAGYNKAGFLFAKYGKWIILHHPYAFFKGFILKNIDWYIEPDHEILQRFFIAGKLNPEFYEWYHIDPKAIFVHYDFIEAIGWNGARSYKKLLCIFILCVLLCFVSGWQKKISKNELSIVYVLFVIFIIYSAYTIFSAKIMFRFVFIFIYLMVLILSIILKQPLSVIPEKLQLAFTKIRNFLLRKTKPKINNTFLK